MMMNEDTITNIIGLTISCLIVWTIIFKLYREYRLEAFRDEMFELRDKMFDDAANGKLNFESDAYRLLRRTMNGFLRYGHNLNIITVLMFCAAYKKNKVTFDKNDIFEAEWQLSLGQVSIDESGLLTSYFDKMNKIAVLHVVIYSPEMLCFLTLIWPIIAVLYLADESRKTCGILVDRITRSDRKAFTHMDSLAYAQGA